MTKIINEGGINGTGQGVVNINSSDYKDLQKAVQEHAKKQSFHQKINYELISLKLQIESYIEEIEPVVIVSSGVFLRKYLKAINVKNKEFANYIEMEEANLSMIMKGKRKINTELAYKLGQIFNINPNYWLLIQSKNELLRIDNKRKTTFKKYRLNDLLQKAG